MLIVWQPMSPIDPLPKARQPPPDRGHVRRVVGAVGGGAEPQVPVDVAGHGRFVLGASLRAVPAAEPHVGLADRADRPGRHEFHRPADAFRRRSLVARLGDHLVLRGRLPHHAGFLHGPSQRFLAIDVLAPFHGRHGRHGVRVIGRAHDAGVDVFVEFVQQAAKVLVAFGLRMLFEGLGSPAVMHVAQGHNGLAGHVAEVTPTHPGHADRRDVQLVVLLVTKCQAAVAEHDQAGSEGDRAAEKTASCSS